MEGAVAEELAPSRTKHQLRRWFLRRLSGPRPGKIIRSEVLLIRWSAVLLSCVVGVPHIFRTVAQNLAFEGVEGLGWIVLSVLMGWLGLVVFLTPRHRVSGVVRRLLREA
jgi:hypothetical protein